LRQNTPRMGAEQKNPLRRLVGPPNAIRAHLLGRDALIDVLSGDPTVTATFGAFATTSDLAAELGQLGEAIARRAGLPGRATQPETSRRKKANGGGSGSIPEACLTGRPGSRCETGVS
jgi:hypothetical protein